MSVEKGPESRLDATVAVLVAAAATVLAVGNIKDGNIVQAMAQAQAQSVSAWNQYQSKSTKENVAESAAEELTGLRELATTAAAQAHLGARIAFQREQTTRYAQEKAQIRAEAEGYIAEYDRLNTHDDQFDMSEACLSVAIALLGVTALTRRRWLLWFGVGLVAVGVALTISGFAGWSFHPTWLARLLG